MVNRRIALHRVRHIALLLGFIPLLFFLARVPSHSSGRLVIVATVDGPILSPTKDYLSRALQRAEREGATCLLVEMNTPGGVASAMREITMLFLNAKVPVVVYVAPSGAQAASAGAIIGLAAHILAMAPSTNIGAAHPVAGTGGNIPGDMRDKVVNDMAALARSIAERRGKSKRWAEDIIRKSISSTETEALKAKIADYVASDRADLFRQMNGRKVETTAGPKRLDTLNARTEEERHSWVEAFLLFICNPNVALILGAIAFYGILAEIQNPGAIFPGVVGGICLILSLYAFSVLSVNVAGLALLLLALVLFVIDVYATSHGVLTVGGIIAFIVGSLMLFHDSEVGVRVSLSVVITLALITAAFSTFILSMLWRGRHRPPGSGPETLIGMTATARTPVNPNGKVFVDGTFWNAVNVGAEPIKSGDTVVIEGRDGLTLKVRRGGLPNATPAYMTSPKDVPGA